MGNSNKKNSIIRRFQSFMESYNGKVIMNYIYSWGASVVILGTLFKLTHLPGANVMLFVGMGTEVFVFFISAFDKPFKSYKWETVFPQIKIAGQKDKEPADESQAPAAGIPVPGIDPNSAIAAANAINALNNAATNMGAAPQPAAGTAPAVAPAAPVQQAAASTPQPGMAYQGGMQTVVIGGGQQAPAASKEQVEEIKNASEAYLNSLKDMSEALEKFKSTTTTLANVSESLASSYKIISDNSGNITANTQGYVYQMENLNRNLTGLNTIYDLQLRSISSQLDTIKQMNDGLTKIREMFANSTENSEKFHEETERMAHQIEELNAVYARMLHAMTVNMK